MSDSLHQSMYISNELLALAILISIRGLGRPCQTSFNKRHEKCQGHSHQQLDSDQQYWASLGHLMSDRPEFVFRPLWSDIRTTLGHLGRALGQLDQTLTIKLLWLNTRPFRLDTRSIFDCVELLLEELRNFERLTGELGFLRGEGDDRFGPNAEGDQVGFRLWFRTREFRDPVL